MEKGIFDTGWASEMHDICIEAGANPLAVYLMCLQRRLAQIPCDVLLPPRNGVGIGGSLNTILLGIGDAGSGKNSSWDLAKAFAPYQEGKIEVRQVGVGTGEHLVHSCIRYVKHQGKMVRADSVVAEDEHGNTLPRQKAYFDSVYSVATEGRLLDKELARDGSKAAEILCEMWTGSFVGSSARGDADRWLAQHALRWNLLLMIQPANLGGFAAQEATGLPQRMVWFSVREPRMPLEMPERRKWLPTMPRMKDPLWAEIPVHRDISQELREQDWQVQLGNTPGNETHRSFARLKIAAAIGFSEGRSTGVTLDDWERSGAIMNASDAVRERALDCQQAWVRAEAAKAAALRGHAAAHGRQAEADAKAEIEEERAELEAQAAAAILEILADGPLSNEDLRNKLPTKSYRGAVFREAVDFLVRMGQIERLPANRTHGTKWHLKAA
ncbi:hypothetical protein ACWDTP_05010 [Mycobacterium sp. NPDC003449]